MSVDGKVGVHRAFARGDKVDTRRLIPDNVLAAEALHDHQHEKRISHRIQAAAELSADIVAVVPAQAHFYLHLLEVRADMPHPHAGADIGRIEVQRPAQKSSLAG